METLARLEARLGAGAFVAIDHSDDEQTHTLRPYDHEDDWGSGDGEPLDWWCIDAPDAYVSPTPLYRTEEGLLRRVLGNDLYDSFKKYQSLLIEEFDKMAVEFKFEVVDARKSLEDIQDELRSKIQQLLTEEGLARTAPVVEDAQL